MSIERTFYDLESGADAASLLGAARLGHSSGFTWNDVLGSKRVLLVTEAGMGKTFECRRQAERLWDAGEAAIYLDLAGLKEGSLRGLLSAEQEKRFDQWLVSQSDIATFFLDSIDELELTLGKFDNALTRFAKPLDGHLQRLRVVITTRPIPIDEEIFRRRLPVPPVEKEKPTSTDFANRATEREPQWEREKKGARPEWRNVALLPLTNDQIRSVATLQGVQDVDAFMADIHRHDAEEFARRPQDLIQLCDDFLAQHAIRTRADQIESNIRIKLNPRADHRERAELSDTKALEGAQRLALASLLSRSLAIRHNAESDVHGNQGMALDPARVLPDWSAKERVTLLERPLFGFVTYGRVGFHHRSVTEYLAAEELFSRLERGTPRASVRRLLFAETAQGEVVVRPSMRPVAAWLARRRQDIFERIRDIEPSILLDFGDPKSLSLQQRTQALGAYVGCYGTGGWRGLAVPYLQVRRFASPELGFDIRRIWEEGVQNPEVRKLLLRLIEMSKAVEGGNLAWELTTDPNRDDDERILAADALIALNDLRLPELCNAVELDRVSWPNELARAAIVRLFPEVMCAEQLCRVLITVTEPSGAVAELAYHLPQTIEVATLSTEQLEVLRDGLSTLVMSGIYWHAQYYKPATHRCDLVSMLMAVCIRLLSMLDVPNTALIKSVVQVLRLSSRDDVGQQKREKELRAKLGRASSAIRAAVFWEDEQLFMSIYPQPDRWKRLSGIAFRGPFDLTVDRDWAWLCTAIEDAWRPMEQRVLALDTAIDMARRREASELPQRLSELRRLVVGQEELIKSIDDASRGPDPSWAENAAEQNRHQQERENEAAAAHRSWVKFWQEVAENPDLLFSDDKAENTVWNLWRAMSRNGEESRSSGWNRRFIEDHFNVDVADRLRLALMQKWRSEHPTLRSERPDEGKNTYPVLWQLGLAGIAAEAEDPEWAGKLSDGEAQKAARYAPVELNGFPSWFNSLVVTHPGAVDAVLGSELSTELDELLGVRPDSITLQNIEHASPASAALFVPRLMRWLQAKAGHWAAFSNHAAAAYRLSQALRILVKHGDTATRRELCNMAAAELASGGTREITGTWLPILLQLDPAGGVSAFEQLIAPLPIEANGEAVYWFAELFDYHGGGGVGLTVAGITPDLILRLLCLAYTHVRVADDIQHEGVYTSDMRDNAQSGRNHILNALLSFKGREGWAAKVAMANDPLVAHFKDRLIALAKEASALEADGTAFTYQQLASLERFGEAPPMTRDAMFALMRDRLSDLDDLLLDDTSPRELWATIRDEHLLRRAIAHELRGMANHCYTVDQESVTADEKETDIRLRTTASDVEGVIELKVGEGDWSGSKLRDTLRMQLVERYMAAESCRAGCLLITVASDKKWNHPDTGPRMSFDELIEYLTQEAAKLVEEYGGALRLLVKGLDLRPRIT